MSYVRHILRPDEQILRVGRVHWVVYLCSLALAVICGVLLHLASRPNGVPTPLLVGAAVSAVLAAIELARAWFWKWATEFAVTNRRIIYKRGFIRRDTIEMNTEKVETVEIHQSVLGRLLNYGTLDVKGTGQSIEHLRTIARPAALRNAMLAR